MAWLFESIKVFALKGSNTVFIIYIHDKFLEVGDLLRGLGLHSLVDQEIPGLHSIRGDNLWGEFTTLDTSEHRMPRMTKEEEDDPVVYEKRNTQAWHLEHLNKRTDERHAFFQFLELLNELWWLSEDHKKIFDFNGDYPNPAAVFGWTPQEYAQKEPELADILRSHWDFAKNKWDGPDQKDKRKWDLSQIELEILCEKMGYKFAEEHVISVQETPATAINAALETLPPAPLNVATSFDGQSLREKTLTAVSREQWFPHTLLAVPLIVLVGLRLSSVAFPLPGFLWLGLLSMFVSSLALLYPHRHHSAKELLKIFFFSSPAVASAGLLGFGGAYGALAAIDSGPTTFVLRLAVGYLVGYVLYNTAHYFWNKLTVAKPEWGLAPLSLGGDPSYDEAQPDMVQWRISEKARGARATLTDA